MTDLRFGLTKQAIEMLDCSYNELLKITVEETEEAMGKLYVISNTVLAWLEYDRQELVVIRLVRYMYHVRHNLDNACEDMYMFLRLFFWMYHYDTSEPCTEEEYFEVQELGKIFNRLCYYFHQRSAVFTARDCVTTMRLVAAYYHGCHVDNDSMHRVREAEMMLYDAIAHDMARQSEVISFIDADEVFKKEANKGWTQVMDYVERRSKYFEKKKTSNELEEIDRERIRKEEPMEQKVQEELPVNSIRCDKCGKVISKYEGSVFDETNEHWCRECANEFLEEHDDYIRCYQCSTIVPKDEATKDYAGDWFCEECTENFLTTCEECGDVVWADDCHWIESEEREVCNACFDRYYETCTHCGKTFRRSDMNEVNGEYYCDNCYDELFVECHECGETISVESARVDDYGDYYCEDCYRRTVCGILPYHDDSVEFEVNYMPGEDELNEVTIGIEHEVGCDREDKADNAKQVIARMNQRFEYENVALFEDSSVEGFEIVSQPMTVRYFKEKFLPQYEKTMEWMENAGMVGTDEGGMHIHFRIPCLDRVMVARLNNVLYGNQKDSDHDILQTISRRTPSEFNRWCSTGGRCYSTKQLLDSPHLYRCTCGVRNTVLNYDSSRTDTYELRMFNSTLDRDEYVASVEFVLALVDFVREDDGRGPYVTLRDFIVFINEHQKDYPAIHKQLDILDVFQELYIEPKRITKVRPKSEVETKIEVDTETLNEAFNSLYPDGVEDDLFTPLQITESERNWIAQTVDEIFSGV